MNLFNVKEFTIEEPVGVKTIAFAITYTKPEEWLKAPICKLDKLEYEYHKNKMGYSKELDIVINNALKELINEYKDGAIMFDSKLNKQYLETYMDLKKELENSNFS